MCFKEDKESLFFGLIVLKTMIHHNTGTRSLTGSLTIEQLPEESRTWDGELMVVFGYLFVEEDSILAKALGSVLQQYSHLFAVLFPKYFFIFPSSSKLVSSKRLLRFTCSHEVRNSVSLVINYSLD